MNSVSVQTLPAFFTILSLAERWQVSPKTIRRMVSRKEILIHRIGKQIRISADQVVIHERSSRE